MQFAITEETSLYQKKLNRIWQYWWRCTRICTPANVRRNIINSLTATKNHYVRVLRTRLNFFIIFKHICIVIILINSVKITISRDFFLNSWSFKTLRIKLAFNQFAIFPNILSTWLSLKPKIFKIASDTSGMI